MALNKLVGGDCGGNNTLVQLSSIVGRDASMGHSSISHGERFVSEFLSQNAQHPQTFNMKSLLGSVHDIEAKQQMTTSSRENMMNANVPQFLPGPSTSYSPSMHYRPFYPPPIMYQSHLPPSNVQIQYMNESDLTKSQLSNDADLRAKAQEVVDTVQDDDELAYNQFMSFMKKVSSGEVNLSGPDEEVTRKVSQDEMLHEMEEKYKDEWAKLSNVSEYWQSEAAYGIPKEYNFTDGNIMLENKNALEIGKEKLKMGDVPGAVLCFEAAVQQQPELAEAWFLLGTTQAENEQDPLAISALKKSLEIDPRQSEAYMTLAAAYTNENLAKLAFLSLHDWLKASPHYSDLLPQDVNLQIMDNKELENHVKSLYIKAAQLNPSQVDPNVQNALGVLFNITQEYDKAVDCFRTALMVASGDSKLWNRLGATLANSERSEEAVDAYREALNLEPGFIRARYNVGITCMNLGAYREAAEHFLVALNQQHKARGLYPEASSVDNSSSTIWSTLRMVCAFLGEQDVTAFVDGRDLTELNRFFGIQRE